MPSVCWITVFCDSWIKIMNHFSLVLGKSKIKSKINFLKNLINELKSKIKSKILLLLSQKSINLHIEYICQWSLWFILKRRRVSNLLSVSRVRLHDKTSAAMLKSRSTGALDGRVVLYFKKRDLIFGHLSKHLKSRDSLVRKWSTSVRQELLVLKFKQLEDSTGEINFCCFPSSVKRLSNI